MMAGLTGGGGLIQQITRGAIDGLSVVGGQIVARKGAALINGVLPNTLLQGQPTVRGLGTRLVAALVTTAVARKVVPAQARMLAAGAFAEVVTFALNANPSLAGFLSAYPSGRVLPGRGVGRIGAYPRGLVALPAGRAGVGAYPRQVGTMYGVGG
jgi:hypothetical protein